MRQQPSVLRQSDSERVEPLSILPVFLDLTGKSAIVIGGEEPALWKAELLAKAGAKVKLICKSPSIEILQFVSNTQSQSPISLIIADWRDEDFSETAVIVADVREDEAAELFFTARKCASMLNVIDKPAYCTFQFGSIVNKSPLVIGISTSGAAPVLAQHVRSLLEASLPTEIQSLARRAARIRTRVNERLGESLARRGYWHAFFGKAFGFKSQRAKMTGTSHVIRVLDVEDLTLRDLRALQCADLVYLQAGANPAIVKLARREAVRLRFDSNNEQNDRIFLGGSSVTICNSGCGILPVNHEI